MTSARWLSASCLCRDVCQTGRGRPGRLAGGGCGRVKVVPRGAGTGVSGGAHATARCIVFSLERMDRLVEIRPQDEVVVVQPGVINAVPDRSVTKHGLMYAPAPVSYRQSTIGERRHQYRRVALRQRRGHPRPRPGIGRRPDQHRAQRLQGRRWL